MSPWIPTILVFVAAAFATVAVVLVLEGGRAWYRRRDVTRRVDDMLTGRADLPADATGSLFRERRPEAGGLELLVARLPKIRDVPVLLEHARSTWSMNTFVFLTIGLAVAFGLAAMTAGAGPIVAAILALVGAWLPYAWLKLKKSRHLNRFEEAFPEAIDMLGRAIRAGHPLSAGIQMVGQEMPDPVGGEFRTLSEESRFGVPFAEAMMGMVDRVDLVDVRIFSTAILVQREVGGNLAEILDNISNMIRSRFKIRRQLRTYTAQGRMSGIVVGLMPLVVGVAFYFLNPEYVRLLFEHPIGRVMLAFAVVMQIFGYFWIRKIVNIEI